MIKVELGKNVNLVTKGTTPTTLGKDFTSSGVKFLRAQNVINGKVLINEDILFINDKTHNDELKRSQIKKGDVLLTIAGTIGRTAIVDTDEELNCNQAVAIIRLGDSKIDKRYLCHYIASNDAQEQFNKGKVTATISNLSLEQVKKLKIPLPPLDQQKKIANILDAADAYRQKTKALISKYDELTQSLFLDMFGDPVKNEKGWEVKTIEAITKKEKGAIKRGPFGGALKKEIFVEEGYLVYEQYHALNNDFSFERYYINEEKFQELKGFEVKPGDIIVSCSGVYLGKLAIIPNGAKKGIINQALLKLTLDQSKMTNHFFTFHFSQKSFRETFFDANRGAGIPNFPPISDFKRFPFISPPIDLQNQFAERVQSIEQQKAKTQKSLEKAEALFQSLLQRAFKGELN